MDFINDRLESDTAVGVVREAETSISYVEDDENNFFFTKRKTSASELQLFMESHTEELPVYASWPKLRQLFIELNTPVPASAACETLFSCAGLIFRPHRSSVMDRNFENSLLVKLNKNFV